jgi:phosphatidylserine/phosphatidylglycerophosphate/cardiolipin synthase-like enzyme
MWRDLVLAIRRLVDRAPVRVSQQLAEEVRSWGDLSWPMRRWRGRQCAAQPRLQEYVVELIDRWEAEAPELPPEVIAFGLECAGATAGTRQDGEGAVELVWTGPSSVPGSIPMRRTDQALLQVIASATRSLLVVSFAAYRARAVVEALAECCRRGVDVRVCLDGEGDVARMRQDVRRILGEVDEGLGIYVWPEEQRLRAGDGGSGVLHAKCAVADGALLFISSANLTEYALSRNIELGVLVRGGPLPGRVEAQFRALMDRGVLRRVG